MQGCKQAICQFFDSCILLKRYKAKPRIYLTMKNKGFVSNKSVSASVGKSIRASKSTVGARVKRCEVSIDMNRDILGVSRRR